jgi:hypothetical protein
LQNDLIYDFAPDQAQVDLAVDLPQTPGPCWIEIERWGKTAANTQDGADQVVEIKQLYVNDMAIPQWFLWGNSQFRFNDQCQQSLIMAPNGVWRLDFATPLITHILDQKILHEAQYNQDYQYPWSYKFGPGQTEELDRELANAMDLVRSKL